MIKLHNTELFNRIYAQVRKVVKREESADLIELLNELHERACDRGGFCRRCTEIDLERDNLVLEFQGRGG